MDDGHIVVDSIAPVTLNDITYDLARESGFESVDDLLRTARHGRGDNVYLIRFHYLPPGAWDTRGRAMADTSRGPTGVYVALLGGIDVGGNNIVSMKADAADGIGARAA
jgi:hypothetical protein